MGSLGPQAIWVPGSLGPPGPCPEPKEYEFPEPKEYEFPETKKSNSKIPKMFKNLSGGKLCKMLGTTKKSKKNKQKRG